jgi:hypothetical protein
MPLEAQRGSTATSTTKLADERHIWTYEPRARSDEPLRFLQLEHDSR